MKISEQVFLISLLFLFGVVNCAVCQDFTSPDFEDVNLSDGDSLTETSAHWDDLSFTGDFGDVKNGAFSVDAGKGTLDDDAVAALLAEIELRIMSGKSLTGEITVNGKEVLLSEELNRQLEIWKEASRKVLVSSDPENGLSSFTDSEFVDEVKIDSPDFENLFATVIDSEKMANTDDSQISVPHQYAKVANLYKALSDDMFSYNNSCFLAANSSDYEVAGKAKASAAIIEQRMKTYVDTLKRVLIKG